MQSLRSRGVRSTLVTPVNKKTDELESSRHRSKLNFASTRSVKNIVSFPEIKTECETFNGNWSKKFMSFAMTASYESWVWIDSESRGSGLKTEITRNPSIWSWMFSIIENQVSSRYRLNILAGVTQRMHKIYNKVSFNKFLCAANPTEILVTQISGRDRAYDSNEYFVG